MVQVMKHVIVQGYKADARPLALDQPFLHVKTPFWEIDRGLFEIEIEWTYIEGATEYLIFLGVTLRSIVNFDNPCNPGAEFVDTGGRHESLRFEGVNPSWFDPSVPDPVPMVATIPARDTRYRVMWQCSRPARIELVVVAVSHAAKSLPSNSVYEFV
jgi:hypothetical protein